MGLRAVVIDFDRQGSQTTLFDLSAPDGRSTEVLHQVLMRKTKIADALTPIDSYMVPELGDAGRGTLHVVQGGPQTKRAIDLIVAAPLEYDMLSDLEMLQEPIKDLTGLADIVIVDMGPSDQRTSIAGLVATDHLLIPTTMDYLSVERIHPTLREFAATRRANANLNLLGIVPVMSRYYFGGLRESKNVQAGREFLRQKYNDMLLRDARGEQVDIPYREDWRNVMWAAMPLFAPEVPKKCKDEALRFLNAVGHKLGLPEVSYA
jgi:cellulose biosynthesis protein BcsQ